jgi:hypothetical protein
LLLRYKTDLFNSLNKLADQLFEGSPNEKFEKGLEYDNARSDFENLLDALNKRGTEWGREGRWRQALVKEDYSFVTQERVARAAKRENLTKPEQERLKKDTDLLEKNEKRIKELQEQIKNDQERSKLEKEVAQEPKVDPYIQSLIDKIRKNVKSLAEQYREELRKKAKEGRLMTGIDPTDIHKYAVIGADHLLEGISDFSRWSEKMISDWGEKIRPHLDEIFNKAKQFNEQQINKETKGSASDKKKVVKATSPEESRRKAQVTRARNRLAELKAEEERVNKGDFTKKEKRPPLEPSEEVNRLREESAKIKDRIDQQRIKWERANRKTTSKVLDFIARLNRVNILSHLSVFEHLAGAAVENIVTRPMGSIAAQLFRFSKTLDAIRRKAVYEGGLSPKSEFKGITGVLKSLPNVWNKLTKGKTGMDWLHGDKKHPKEFLSIVENTHAAIKEPVRQGIYSRSLQLRIEAAEKAGLDPTHDEALTTILSAEAYNDANMDIFMGDNFLSKKLRAFIDGKVKDHERVGKFFSTLMEIALPIVNVSTNIAIRKARLLFGLAESAGRLIAVAGEGKLANGAEKLTQKEAELITRSFKYGVMGLALGVYAWTNPDKFGGIYSPVGTQAPKNKKLEKGQIKIGSVTVPKEMTHGPVGGFMNMIADARRLYDSKIRGNRNSKWSGVSEATFFSALVSGIGNIPVTQTALRWTSPFTSAAQKTGQQVRETFIPGMLQDAAKIIDPTKRIPKDFIDELEMGIPYLRKNVPVSHRR